MKCHVEEKWNIQVQVKWFNIRFSNVAACLFKHRDNYRLTNYVPIISTKLIWNRLSVLFILCKIYQWSSFIIIHLKFNSHRQLERKPSHTHFLQDNVLLMTEEKFHSSETNWMNHTKIYLLFYFHEISFFTFHGCKHIQFEFIGQKKL